VLWIVETLDEDDEVQNVKYNMQITPVLEANLSKG